MFPSERGERGVRVSLVEVVVFVGRHTGYERFVNRTALDSTPDFPAARVDFGRVIQWKMSLLQRAFAHFSAHARDEQVAALEAFCNDHAH
jgi:4-alpha-glucanotransferase